MSTLETSNRPRGVVRKRELRAYTAGMQAAVRTALPTIERRYRIAAVGRFWLALALAFAAGLTLGQWWPL
jgi:hypothetical protein